MSCPHSERTCINPFDLIRKYRCFACGEVMMCACDEDRGRRFLPHQLYQGTELVTKDRVPVTMGFQTRICAECRGMQTESLPVAAIHGRTTKIARYYWREIFFRGAELFEEWKQLQPASIDEWGPVASEIKESFHKVALEEIKKLHEASPKYVFKGSTREDTLKVCRVDVVKFSASYLKVQGQKRARVLSGSEPVLVEEYVKRHFERSGARVLEVESVPFHVLFGTFLFHLIQDPADSKVRISSFGCRHAFDQGTNGPLISTFLPSDFGSQGYGQRRAEAIDAYFEGFPHEREDLLWHFDYSLSLSEPFRQYLWAHRDKDIETARTLLEVLPGDAIHKILRYLIDSYWERFVGWPDLLVIENSALRFVEVKSSKDKLSEDQERWIKDNQKILKFPFTLAKIHRLQ